MTYSLSEFKQRLFRVFEMNSLSKYCNDEKAELFYRFADILLETNKSMNLTAVKDDDGVILKHFADSLIVAEYIPEGARVIDVGCGAGFPSFPLAIARPDLSITSLDSTEKKINFVRSTAKSLSLSNINAISGRAEELAKDARFREKYDAVTARAVSRLNILSELCLPFLRKNGVFVAMKGAIGAEEAAEAEHGIGVLGGKIEDIREKKLYVGEGEMQDRVFVLVRKIEKTPLAYPRMYSRITKSPL